MPTLPALEIIITVIMMKPAFQDIGWAQGTVLSSFHMLDQLVLPAIL